MKFTKRAESDGGSLSYLGKFSILILVLIVVAVGASTDWNEFKNSITGLDDQAFCESKLGDCDNSQNKKNLREDSYDIKKRIQNLQGYDLVLQKYANENNILSKNLKIILAVESEERPFDSSGKATVRFECHIFNGDSSFCTDLTSTQKVSCDGFDKDRGYSTESLETNRAAFEKALKIDKDLAICSSSFGAGQIMGFHYDDLDFKSYEDFMEAMDEGFENQIEIMMKFLSKNSKVTKELAKEQPDWNIVADYYSNRDDYVSLLKDVSNELGYS